MPCRSQWNIDHTDRYSSSSFVLCSCLYLLLSVFETCFSSVLPLWPCGVHCSTCLAVSSFQCPCKSVPFSSFELFKMSVFHKSLLFYSPTYTAACFMHCVFFICGQQNDSADHLCIPDLPKCLRGQKDFHGSL